MRKEEWQHNILFSNWSIKFFRNEKINNKNHRYRHRNLRLIYLKHSLKSGLFIRLCTARGWLMAHFSFSIPFKAYSTSFYWLSCLIWSPSSNSKTFFPKATTFSFPISCINSSVDGLGHSTCRLSSVAGSSRFPSIPACCSESLTSPYAFPISFL